MSSKIYVGGLPYATTDAQLQEIFSAHGTGRVGPRDHR